MYALLELRRQQPRMSGLASRLRRAHPARGDGILQEGLAKSVRSRHACVLSVWISRRGTPFECRASCCKRLLKHNRGGDPIGADWNPTYQAYMVV